MARQQTFEQMEDRREVRGMEYDDGVWTGRLFQPTLLCKHQREMLTYAGWVLQESSHMWWGEGVNSKTMYIPAQKCEHAKV